MLSVMVDKSEAVKKPSLSWRVYVVLGLLAGLGVEFGLMHAYRSVRFYYFQNPAFTYAPVAVGFITALGYVVLILLLVGVLALIFIPFRFQRLLHILLLTWMSGGLIAIMMVSIPKARQAALRSLARKPASSLIEAIGLHVEKTGHPPEALEDLMPDYIGAIPGTGFARFPEFAYEAKPLAGRPGSIWQLRFEYQEPEGDEFVLFHAGVDPKGLSDDRNASSYWERVTQQEFDAEKR